MRPDSLPPSELLTDALGEELHAPALRAQVDIEGIVTGESRPEATERAFQFHVSTTVKLDFDCLRFDVLQRPGDGRAVIPKKPEGRAAR